MPDIGEVARPTPGNDENGVDPDIVAAPHEARCQLLRGDRHSAQAMLIEREVGGFGGAARLDLNEGEGPASPGNDVDFTAAHPRAALDHTPAVQPQIPAGESLGAAAALLGGVAVQRISSSTRA